MGRGRRRARDRTRRSETGRLAGAARRGRGVGPPGLHPTPLLPDPHPLPTPSHTRSRVWVDGPPHTPRSPPTSCDDVGGREPLRRPRTRHDSHTIVASTRARSRSTNLSIYLIRYRANRRARLAPTAALVSRQSRARLARANRRQPAISGSASFRLLRVGERISKSRGNDATSPARALISMLTSEEQAPRAPRESPRKSSRDLPLPSPSKASPIKASPIKASPIKASPSKVRSPKREAAAALFASPTRGSVKRRHI